MNILFLDDDRNDFGLLRDAFYEVDSSVTIFNVNHAHDVHSYVLARKPDVIFLTLNIPDGDGFECLKVFKSNPETRDIPVVIYSTAESTSTIEKGYSLGAARYFVKPVTYKRVVNGLKLLLAMYSINELVRNNFDDFVVDMGPLEQLS